MFSISEGILKFVSDLILNLTGYFQIIVTISLASKSIFFLHFPIQKSNFPILQIQQLKFKIEPNS